MVSIIYAISFIVSVASLIVLLEKRRVYDVYHVMLSATIALCNLGYLMQSMSRSLEAAILSNKISYLGCFLPFFMFMVFSKLCKIKMYKWIKLPMAIFSIFVYGCVLTIGYSDLYYKTVEFALVDGAGTLVRTYGIAHSLYSVLIYGFMAATIFIILLSFRRRKEVSRTTVFWLGILTVLTCAAFGLQKLLPIQIELMPLVYGFNSILLIYLLGKSDMYDISVSLIRANERDTHIGHLIFKKNRQYCEASDAAKEIFPDIADLEIDRPVPPSSSFFYNSIVLWFYENLDSDGNPSKIITVDDSYFNVCLKKIRYGNKGRLIGYLVEFTDVTAEQKYLQLISSYNEKLENDVKAKTDNIVGIQSKIILGIATIIESRDSSTGDHIKRTHDIVSIFSKKLCEIGFEGGDFLDEVVKAAPMHDIGKISVDDDILKKKGKYSPEEYAEMQKHSAAGAGIIRKILDGVESPEFVEIAVNVAHYHHEKWDGSGYPDRIKETEIPVEARIMALADVFDALVSKRCYKEAFTYDEAFEIIRDSLGKHFDPQLGLIFIGCKDELTKYYESVNAAEQ